MLTALGPTHEARPLEGLLRAPGSQGAEGRPTPLLLPRNRATALWVEEESDTTESLTTYIHGRTHTGLGTTEAVSPL